MLAELGHQQIQKVTDYFAPPSNSLTFGYDHRADRPWRWQMAAIARVLARNFSTTAPETETLKYIAMLCGAGLLVSLVLMSYGLDLSPGFF